MIKSGFSRLWSRDCMGLWASHPDHETRPNAILTGGFDFIECFTITFLRTHSWLNWVDFNWSKKMYWWSAGPITCTLVFRWSCQCWDGSSTLNQQYMVWTWWSAGQSSVRFRWSCTFSVGQGPPDHWLFWPLLICQYWLDFGKYSYTGQQPEWKHCELPWGASSDCLQISVSDQSWPWEYIVFFSRIQKLFKGVGSVCPHPHSNIEWNSEWFYAGSYNHTLFWSIWLSYRTFRDINHCRYTAICSSLQTPKTVWFQQGVGVKSGDVARL